MVLRAGQGSRGTKVLLLQRGLRRLGFAVPVSGRYEAGTSRAVLAFRKTNGLSRNGFASAGIYSLVLRGRGAFKLRFPKAGKHVEFDWSRQVLVLADKGKPRRVYHSSSGAPATPTVFGSFRFYRKDLGTNALGMVHSNYFIRGYAIHGYHTVPNYPASHGCLRVPIPNALDIFKSVAMGERSSSTGSRHRDACATGAGVQVRMPTAYPRLARRPSELCDAVGLRRRFAPVAGLVLVLREEVGEHQPAAAVEQQAQHQERGSARPTRSRSRRSR